MRTAIFRILIFTCCLQGLTAANTAETLKTLTERTDRAICTALRPKAKDCGTVIESATQNALAGGDNLWGFSYSIRNQGIQSAKDAEAMKAALRALGAGVLELEKNRIAAISYYRESKGSLLPIGPEDFHRLALNPASGIVARLDPAFLATGGTLSYQTPAEWQKEGAPAGSSGTVQLTLRTPKAARVGLDILNLDDQKLHTVNITACRIKAENTEKPCDIQGVDLSPQVATTISLDIKLMRNLKTEQPAFKLVVKTGEKAATLVNLAIPFRPRPNYFLFGVTGFLFGGLIAVMVIIGKRHKPVNVD